MMHPVAADDRELHNMRTGSRWRSIRKRHLRMFPLCAWCLDRGIVKAADIVHHLEPHKGDRNKMFTGKLVSLCKTPCHDSIAQTIEKRGHDIAISPSGEPVDRNHPWWRD